MAEPGNIEDLYPLSPLQKGMLFHALYAPEEAAYHDHIVCLLRVPGGLEVEAFEAAVEDVVTRHPSLRTAFFWKLRSAPHQVVLRRVRPRLELLDWRALDAAERTAREAALLAADRGRPYDLARPPLMRPTLIRVADDAYRLVFSYHHIVMDAWSVPVVLGEVLAGYSARRRGARAALPAATPFRTYVGWLARRQEGESERFWRRLLAGFDAATPLGYDRAPVPDEGPRRDGDGVHELAPAATAALKDFARGAALTLNTVVQGALALLLARVSGRRDVLFGSVVAGRPHDLPGVESTVGLFTNTLPVRVRCDPGRPAAPWLAELQAGQIEQRQHQWTPLPDLQEWSGVSAGEPLFDCVLVFQNTPAGAGLGAAGGDIELCAVDHDPRNNFPLTLMVMPGERLRLRLIYDLRRFDATTIERRLRLLAALLEGLRVAGPETRLGELPALSAAERHLLLVEDGADAAGPWRDRAFPELFRERAMRVPEAVAARSGERAVSYQDLARRARAGAAKLGAPGPAPNGDWILAILAERGIDFLAAVLAAFEAGGAYLPLDPAHPPVRLAQLLARSRTPRVTVAASLAPLLARALADLPAPRRPQVLALEELCAGPPPAAAGGAERSEPDRLAYVIYTSGSTGVPKGAMVSQGGMVNHLHGKIRELGLGPGDVVAQTASQCFDISVWQFLAPLLVGGRVVIVGDEEARDPLLAEVDRGRCSILETVPSFLGTILDVADDGAVRPPLGALRWLIPTGEALPPELCRRWLGLFPRIPLLNAYGPTECSDDVTHHRIRRPPAPACRRVPIGRPLPGLRLYLVGRDLRPVPAGAAGELCAAGIAIGRGYLHEPARTAAVFVPDAFAPRPGGRLYRTGDLVQRRADGAYEFFGRIDHQVKVRGFRIELGEIEALLAQHPRVAQAAVVVREGEGESGRLLIGYLVPRSAGNPAADSAEPWRAVFDEVYRRGEVGAGDAGINLRVWISSYTGEPFSETEILESVEDSVARIAELEPRRVLELGCGTGLMLFRLAPAAQRYVATDLSGEAIAALGARVAELDAELAEKVRLLERPANDWSGLDRRAFDLVLMNEIVQYFPSVDYLVEVLAGAVERVRPGGHVFLGGLRSFPLLRTFHLSTCLFRAADGAAVEELRAAVERQLEQEKELAVDPRLFLALRRRWPQIRRVRFQLKGGRHLNEFTRFRYDAILEIGAEPAPEAAMEWRHWRREGWSLERLRRHLNAEAPPALALAGIPNARLLFEVRAGEALANLPATATVAELRRAAAEATAGAVDPMALWELAADLGYRAEVTWSAAGDPESIDVAFHRPGSAPPLAAERELPPDQPRLYANVPWIAAGAADGLVPELEAYLRRRLPDYMVPHLLVALSALPVTRNGKVDRAALRRRPLPAVRKGMLPAAAGAARTPAEELLQGIWSQLLGISRVAVDQPFFEIGGHSLLAIQMLSRIRATFGVELPLRAVFEASTVRQLARLVAAQGLRGAAPEAPSILPAPRDGELPVSFAQQRLWILERLDPGKPTYNVPIALRLEGKLDQAAAVRAMTEVVRRQEGLRACFREVDHRPVQIIREPFPFALPEIDLRALPAPVRAAESERLARWEARRVFDLERGPLLRGCLLHLAGDCRVVLLTIHHIISDAWSMGVLVQDFAAIYGAFAEGRPSPLPELPIQYVDFAAWQRRWLSGEVLERQLAFWRRQLRPPLPTLALPADRPPPAVPTARGHDHPFRLGPELAGPLLELGREHGTTLFMTLLAAFTTLLYRITGQSDVIVGTDVANRNWEETEGLIGFFVNLLVLRIDLSGSPTFRQLLDRVRAVALESYAHQDLPFDQLVSDLRLDRGRGEIPLVDVLFVFQNAPVAPLELPGLRLRPLEIDYGVSRFNLGLFMDEANSGVNGHFTYRTDLFSPAAIEGLGSRLRTLLASAVAGPDRPIDELDLHGGEERRRRAAAEESRKLRAFGKFKQVKPKSIQLGELR